MTHPLFDMSGKILTAGSGTTDRKQAWTALTETFSTYDAPKSLPPQPLTTIGAKANLAFKEWIAAIE